MLAHEIKPPAGSRHKRKRVGRGNASGHGTYAGRGVKGQKSRSGPGLRLGFEGGQLPFIKRMARKRGFTNPFRVEYAAVNVAVLERFPAHTEVTPQLLRELGIVKRNLPIKFLGEGQVSKPLKVMAQRFSAQARQKIEAAGGQAQEVAP